MSAKNDNDIRPNVGSDLADRIISRLRSNPRLRAQDVARIEGTTIGYVYKITNMARKAGLLPEPRKNTLKPYGNSSASPFIASNDPPRGQRQNDTNADRTNERGGLTPAERKILFRERTRGKKLEQILAEYGLPTDAALSEVEAVEGYRASDTSEIQKDLLEITNKEEFFRRDPELKLEHQQLQSEFAKKGWLNRSSFRTLIDHYATFAYKGGVIEGKLESCVPQGYPIIVWTKVICRVCGKPLNDLAVDASTPLGQQVFERYKDRMHSSCESIQRAHFRNTNEPRYRWEW